MPPYILPHPEGVLVLCEVRVARSTEINMISVLEGDSIFLGFVRAFCQFYLVYHYPLSRLTATKTAVFLKLML